MDPLNSNSTISDEALLDMGRRSFVIRDIDIFTGTHTISNGYIHVRWPFPIIQSMGRVSDMAHDDFMVGTRIYSKPGHTLVPGLIDSHIHADKGNPLALTQSLLFGVTTVCDMHNELENVRKLQMLERGPPSGLELSRYMTSGQAATIENGWPIPVITAHDKSAETAAEIASWPKLKDREGVREYLDWNKRMMWNDYVKVMHESGTSFGLELNKPTTELLKIVVEEAKERGNVVVAHATSLKDTLEVLQAGVDGVMHAMCDQPPTEELVAAYKKNNAFCNPTLATIGSLTTEGKEMQERYAHDPRVQRLLGEGQSEKLCKCLAMANGHAKVEYAYENVRMLRKARVDIIAGSDAAGPALGNTYGLTLHQELALLVSKCGMTPKEAIQSATIVPGRRFKLWKFPVTGTLQTGAIADMLLVEGNPLKDIDNLLNIRGVWREGKLCSAYKEVMGEGQVVTEQRDTRAQREND